MAALSASIPYVPLGPTFAFCHTGSAARPLHDVLRPDSLYSLVQTKNRSLLQHRGLKDVTFPT